MAKGAADADALGLAQGLEGIAFFSVNPEGQHFLPFLRAHLYQFFN